MSDNSFTITVSVSDDLLKKVATLLAPRPSPSPLGIPAALLPALMAGSMAPPKGKEETEEKTTIGFKIEGGEQ